MDPFKTNPDSIPLLGVGLGSELMRAWRVNELGHHSEVLQLEQVDSPTPGPGQALIRVQATNVNFADILLCQGKYQDRPGVPLTPGLETYGIVQALGDGVDHLAVGDRVAAMAALPAGGYADEALVRASGAVVFPDDVPAVDATVLYTTYQTSHVALHHRANLQAGEWLLVHAGAGGVGSAAIQIGKACGATVIATAGGEAKTDYCRDLGADHVIDYRSESVYDTVKGLTDGRGVDVAFDPVGGDVGDQTRRLMAWEGRLVVIGFASGTVPSYPANHILVKNYTVLGLHWGAYAEHGGRSVIDHAHEELIRLYRDGLIAPMVTETFPLDEVPKALSDLEARKILGRYVMVID